jgi:hypothetical protein
MPVRSSTSSVVRWPDAETVDRALRDWAGRVVTARPEIRRIGYFGSYARGDWGVGSDLDIVIVVASATLPFERRPVEWDVTELPVPAELLIYTEGEWESRRATRFGAVIAQAAIWVLER